VPEIVKHSTLESPGGFADRPAVRYDPGALIPVNARGYGPLMRFEPERATAPAGSSNDAVAERLSATGWRVERWTASASSLPLSLMAVIAVVWAVSGPSPWFRLGLGILGSGSIGFALWRAARSEARRDVPEHLLASDAPPGERPARLLLVARPSPRAFGGRASGPLAWSALVLGLVLTTPAAAAVFRTPGPVGWILLGGTWFGLWLAALRPVDPAGARFETGPGLLAELTRVWPRGAHDRVETWAVVTPDPEDFARKLRGRFVDGKPTLALVLDAPGVGPEVRVGGGGPAAELVAAAARELWVPHRRVRSALLGSGLSGFRRSGVPCVSLSGARADGPVDPESLARLAQLVTETALRWGKLAASAEAQAGASRDRSSQKPG